MPTLESYFLIQKTPFLQMENLVVPSRFTTTESEYWAVRQGVGIFDFSFMRCLEISGAEAGLLIDQIQCRPRAELKQNRIFYTMVVNPEGLILLDATLWRLADDRYWLTTGKSVLDYIQSSAKSFSNVVVRDISDQFQTIAVQGPHSKNALQGAFGLMPEDLPDYFGFKQVSCLSNIITVARLGYTGELGYELFVPKFQAVQIWELLKNNPLVPAKECGFLAADQLRIEAGFILFVNELQQARRFSELGYERFIGRDDIDPKHDFVLVGLLFQDQSSTYGSGPNQVLRKDDLVQVTSRAHSPRLHCDVGLGFIHRSQFVDGKKALTEMLEPVTIKKLPLYRHDREG